MASSSILELSKSVAVNTAKYHDYLVEKGLPLPSHDPEIPQVPRTLPPEITAARDAAIHASYDLYELLIGPHGILLDALFQTSRMLSLDFIYTHRIGQSLGKSDTTTFKEIAQRCNLDEDDTRRMLRLASTNRMFREVEPGVVAHSSASHELATNPLLNAWAGVATKEIWPGYQRTTEALTRWPGSQDPLETASYTLQSLEKSADCAQAFSLAHNSSVLPFLEWEKDPPRAKRFSDAMKYLTAGAQPDTILSAIDYPLPKQGTVLFVDVGGSHGDVSIALAEKHARLSCIVQDLSKVTIQSAEMTLPDHLRGRIEYMLHDFFTEQPIKDAGIYFFRWIFHDWSDEFAIKILRQTIPALKTGARIIVNDACVPPRGVLSAKQERDVRSVDVLMKAFHNAKERDAPDWKELFEKSDPRFRFLGITTLPGARDSIIQAVWSPV